MSEHGNPSALACANCRHPLDPTDKFCRECGLPTLRQAETQRAVPATPPPDTQELRRALDAVPDPQPFSREGTVLAARLPEGPAGLSGEGELTTGGVIRATNPTQAARMAATTVFMVGLILVFAVVGVVLLVLAFRG
jgi:hypothetical protein